MKVIDYIWKSDGGQNMCELCKSLNRTIYRSLEDIPEKPHPNCKCRIIARGMTDQYITPRPWSGKDAPKAKDGRPIHIEPEGNRSIQPKQHSLFSKEAVETKKWDDRVAKERDERLIQDVYEEIKDHEGAKIEHGYACTKGYITFGPGIMISHRDKMDTIPLYKKDRKTLASLGEKKKEYDAIRNRRDDLGQTPGKKLYNHPAKEYEQSTTLLFLDGKRYALKHLRDDIKNVRNKFKKGQFDSFPREVQMVLFEMEYNMGGNFHDGSKDKVLKTGRPGFPNFFEAIRAGNWEWAARECTSSDVQESRNKWRKAMLNSVK